MTIMSKLFSNFYYFYSIDYNTEDNTYIFCGIESIKNEKLLIPEFIKLKNISWKSIFNLMNKVKCLWRMKHFNNELTLEFQTLSKIIFSKLKSCEENLNLREKNIILENDINTEFQTILFDYLYDEQELYEYYDRLFEQKKYIPKNKNIPFSSFINNYQSLYVNIYNDNKKIKRLKKLRWYITFDEDNFLYFSPSTLFSFYNNENEDKNNINNININNELNMLNNLNNNLFIFNNNNSLNERDSFNEKEKDSLYKSFTNNNESINIKNDLKENNEIIITEDIINNLLDKEENPLLYIVKLISITISLFCREAMCYLNSIYNENNNSELIKEYIKRFNNFVQASKYINSQCENINIAINYLDKDILKDYPHFQKFSIFRLCIKIWYTEMSSILTQDNCSLLTKIKKSILKLFSEYTYEDLINMKNSSIQSFLFNSGQSSSSEIFFKSKGNFNLSTSVSLFNSNVNNHTVSSTICPFGSYYEDSNIKYCIIEKGLGIIYETFSDEYSVYLLNLSNIETNNYYDDIENCIINIIESNIKKMFIDNINININDNKLLIKNIVDKTLNYFNNYFYSNRILNKLKKRIYTSIISIIKNLIFDQIEIKIKNILINGSFNKESNNIEVDLNENYIDELYHYLSNKKNMNIEIEKMLKIIRKIDEIENIFDVLSNMDKWLEKENLLFENTDKKVLKELDKNNISSSYNNLQRYLLSFSVKNNWETIRKIRTIENYHQKLNNKKDKKMSVNNSLKESINAYSLHDDLNNLNQFYSEDLNNFGNIDYFSEINNDVDNNNFSSINNNNNNSGNFGQINLKNSSIFFS